MSLKFRLFILISYILILGSRYFDSILMKFSILLTAKRNCEQLFFRRNWKYIYLMKSSILLTAKRNCEQLFSEGTDTICGWNWQGQYISTVKSKWFSLSVHKICCRILLLEFSRMGKKMQAAWLCTGWLVVQTKNKLFQN